MKENKNSRNNYTDNSIQEKNLNLYKPEEKKESKNLEEKNENININENKESELLKEIEFIQDIKINNYEVLIIQNNFVDFRVKEENSWKVGLIMDISDDSYIIQDIKEERKYKIKKDDTNKVSYFRKYSKPDNEENFYPKRENKEKLKKRLNNLEHLTKDGKDNIFNQNAWETYYILHSKFFLGLEAAMKINQGDKKSFFNFRNEPEQNEGFEEI